jgi:hypothetical protein
MADAPSTELVLSPRWAVSVGEIDGTAHVTLRIQHPRLGELAFLLPNNDAIEMAAALEKAWERRDERRLRGASPQGGGQAETVRLSQPGFASWWARLVRAEPSVTTKFTTTATSAADKRSKGSGGGSA